MSEERPADVVNLRLARKRRDRNARGEAAAANRTAHGVSKADRKAARTVTDKAARALDAHVIEGPGSEAGSKNP